VNCVERANGDTEALAGTATIELHAGDTLVIKTPGGGAFGKADD
jgi:5-oxoprolinase (ATP-hydrolysing)